MKTFFATVLVTLMSISFAYGLELQDAKSQGLIGERTDGYVGYVVSDVPENVKALVKSVNNKRREKFQKTARNNSITAEAVGILFYQRALKETKKTHFFQTESGQWVRK